MLGTLPLEAQAVARAESEPPLRVEPGARLATLATEHYPFIWRLLRRLGIPADRADDAAQEVFVVASQRIDDIAVGSERSFLFGTALRVAKSARRASVREQPNDGLEVELDPRPAPDELTEQKRARELLDRILLGLDEELRVVFILFEIEGFTTPEIAETLDVPLGTAASRLRRAREAFEQHVARIEAKQRNATGGAR